MAPNIPSAKLTLACPLFAADFDPRNSDFLLVGGGGGEGRSGVGNRIALLNTSKHNDITQTTEIELSRDEDSVTSMAAHTSGDSVIALAGINSSMAEQKRDNNQHLRSFKLDLPEKEKTETTTIPAESSLLSRESLFRTKGAKAGSDTYQRIVRVSPYKENDDEKETPRVGAITTGLAPSGELVFFEVTSTPKESDVIGRIRLGDGEEAEDVDIIPLGNGMEKQGKFRVVYTNGVDVFTCQISSTIRANSSPDVSRVFTTPLPEGAKTRTRPKFRGLRFLSPTSLLLLQNAPDRNGSELLVMDLSSANEKNPATIVRRKKLRKTIKIGLGLDVCNLGTDGRQHQQQAIIAVTGSDQSIDILTLEHDSSRRGQHGYGKIKPYTNLPDVHPFSVTKICFSNFVPPGHPVTPEVGAQYVKLASVSMGNTVVVHTLPLLPFPAPSHTPRYVLSVPGKSEVWTNLLGGFTTLFTILVACVLIQAVLEIRGGSPSYLGVEEWVPGQVRDVIARPVPWQFWDDDYQSTTISAPPARSLSSVATVPTMTTTISVVPNTLPHQQSLHDILQNTDPSSITVRCSPDSDTDQIIIETLPHNHHDHDQESESGKPSKLLPWEHLSEEQQTFWKRRLVDAGHWIVDEGETILQGVLFAEYCGLVGGVVREELP